MPHTARVLILVSAMFVLGLAPGATQTPVESSVETHFQLDFHIGNAELAPFLPAGWSPSVATQGPAKDANLRVVFIDRMTIDGPEGKPLGSNRLVYLIVPVKDPSGANSQLVISGLTDERAASPGPFGVYLPAVTHRMQRSTVAEDGSVVESQDWDFQAASGEHLELHIKFEKGAGFRIKRFDVKFYSAKDPNLYQISRQELVLDILRNVTTTPVDRVKAFSFKASGGKYAKLFDGTEKVLSWDNIIWIDRSVTQP